MGKQTLQHFELHVLLAMLRERGETYSVPLVVALEKRMERPVAQAAVFIALGRLERKGLVRSRLGSGTPIRDGRARRFYTVLAEGLRALNDARATHETIWRGFARPLKLGA